MTRGKFFQSLLGIVGFQQWKNPTIGGGACLGDDGYGRPCKEGEESCPLGHTNKPVMRSLLIRQIGESGKSGIHLDDLMLEKETSAVCSVCGIVYVQVRRQQSSDGK